LRDGIQSLLAPRVRTQDMVAIAPYYDSVPNCFDGMLGFGATFAVAIANS